MASLKIRRKKKYSRKNHIKKSRNNTKKKYRVKNRTRKYGRQRNAGKYNKEKIIIGGGKLEDELGKITTEINNANTNVKAIMNDEYYKVEIAKDKKLITVYDNQSDCVEDNGYMSNRSLMLLENMVDIIHDVVAEGNLSYDGLLSVDLIVKSYTALYGYDEKEGWELLNQEPKIKKWLLENPKAEVESEELKFKRWYKNTVKAEAESFGKSLELNFKNHLYKNIKNKYLMNPTYTSQGIEAEILTHWQYANTSDRIVDVAPYGGGSIRNGIKLWEYILGRGNSFLDEELQNYNWVEESIPIPSTDDIQHYKVKLEELLDFDNIYKDYETALNKPTIKEEDTEKDEDEIEDDQGEVEREMEQEADLLSDDGSVEEGAKQGEGEQSLLQTPNLVDLTREQDVVMDSHKIIHMQQYYIFYAYVFCKEIDSDSTKTIRIKNAQKNKIFGNFEKLFVIKRNNRLYNFDDSLIHPLHINFTDATSKASSAVPKLYELMKLRGVIYDTYSDNLPFECRGIGQVCDMATGRVGQPVALGSRKPICTGKEDIIFDDALLYAVEVHQRNTKDDQGADKTSFTDLIIKQEITEDDNSEKNINFLRSFNTIYSKLLNDIRMLYKEYIATGYLLSDEDVDDRTLDQVLKSEVTTKDLVKLKFFHLMNYLLFLSEFGLPPSSSSSSSSKTESEQRENKIREEVDTSSYTDAQKEFYDLLELEKLLTKTHPNSILGKKDNLAETDCGTLLLQSMTSSYLNGFFSQNKDKNYTLSDHWNTWGDGSKSRFYLDLTRTEDQKKIEKKPENRQTAVNYVRRSPFFRTSTKNLSSEIILDVAQKKQNKNITNPFIKNTSVTVKASGIYLNKNFTRSNGAIMKEYFSTDFNFENMDEAIDIYNGWRTRNFTDCNCNSTNAVDFTPDYLNSLADPTKLKGICMSYKNRARDGDGITPTGHSIGYKSAEDLPVSEDRPVAVNKGDYISLTDMLKPLQYIRLIIYPKTAKKTGITKYSIKLDLLIANPNRSSIKSKFIRRLPFLYEKLGDRAKPVSKSFTKDQLYQFIIKYFRLCRNFIPGNNPGSVYEPNYLPLDLSYIYRFLRLDPSAENGTNKDFSSLVKRKRYEIEDEETKERRDGYDATTECHNFWKTFGLAPNRHVKASITEMINTIPNVFKLLYNCLLFDFETADLITNTSFAGNRTTGRLRTNPFSQVKNGLTFIQNTINTTIESYVAIKNKIKGKQTITYKKIAKTEDGKEVEDPNSTITFSTSNPSVTGVLSNVRQYIVYCLLTNNKLKHRHAEKLKNNPAFFDIDSRSEKEPQAVQNLTNELIQEFINMDDGGMSGGVKTKVVPKGKNTKVNMKPKALKLRKPKSKLKSKPRKGRSGLSSAVVAPASSSSSSKTKGKPNKRKGAPKSNLKTKSQKRQYTSSTSLR